jgi:hypothetical protein
MRTLARRFVAAAVAVILALLAMPAGAALANDSDGNALDRTTSVDGWFKLHMQSYESIVKGLIAKPGIDVISLNTLLGTRPGSMSSCGDRCKQWPSDLEDDKLWYPQGLTGSEESSWSARPANEVLVSGWYERVSESNHDPVASRLQFISTSDWTYRTVPLRMGTHNYLTGEYGYQPLPIHIGGLAWADRYLYAVDTTRILRFDLTQILRNSGGPFLVPDRQYYNVAGSGGGSARLSSISTDWSSTPPALVTAEWSDDTSADADVVRWPIGDNGALVVNSSDTVLSADALYVDADSSIDKVQGVESANGVYFFSCSSGMLERAKVESQADRDHWRWGWGFLDTWVPQDLYAVAGQRIYGQSEERNDRRIFWKPMSEVMP